MRPKGIFLRLRSVQSEQQRIQHIRHGCRLDCTTNSTFRVVPPRYWPIFLTLWTLDSLIIAASHLWQYNNNSENPFAGFRDEKKKKNSKGSNLKALTLHSCVVCVYRERCICICIDNAETSYFEAQISITRAKGTMHPPWLQASLHYKLYLPGHPAKIWTQLPCPHEL